MDTTSEALDALSEALRPELKDPIIWLPAGLLAIATEVYALRTGRSPVTDIYRWSTSCPVLRGVLAGWAVITAMHLHRWPAALARFDPYSALGSILIPYGVRAASQAKRDLERARSA